MLIVKRFVTAATLFFALTLVFFLGTSMVMGGIAGARASQAAGAKDYESGYESGRKAGEEMGRKYGSTILLGSVGLAAVAALGISFSGVLPWCREQARGGVV